MSSAPSLRQKFGKQRESTLRVTPIRRPGICQLIVKAGVVLLVLVAVIILARPQLLREVLTWILRSKSSQGGEVDVSEQSALQVDGWVPEAVVGGGSDSISLNLDLDDIGGFLQKGESDTKRSYGYGRRAELGWGLETDIFPAPSWTLGTSIGESSFPDGDLAVKIAYEPGAAIKIQEILKVSSDLLSVESDRFIAMGPMPRLAPVLCFNTIPWEVLMWSSQRILVTVSNSDDNDVCDFRRLDGVMFAMDGNRVTNTTLIDQVALMHARAVAPLTSEPESGLGFIAWINDAGEAWLRKVFISSDSLTSGESFRIDVSSTSVIPHWGINMKVLPNGLAVAYPVDSSGCNREKVAFYDAAGDLVRRVQMSSLASCDTRGEVIRILETENDYALVWFEQGDFYVNWQKFDNFGNKVGSIITSSESIGPIFSSGSEIIILGNPDDRIHIGFLDVIDGAVFERTVLANGTWVGPQTQISLASTACGSLSGRLLPCGGRVYAYECGTSFKIRRTEDVGPTISTQFTLREDQLRTPITTTSGGAISAMISVTLNLPADTSQLVFEVVSSKTQHCHIEKDTVQAMQFTYADLQDAATVVDVIHTEREEAPVLVLRVTDYSVQCGDGGGFYSEEITIAMTYTNVDDIPFLDGESSQLICPGTSKDKCEDQVITDDPTDPDSRIVWRDPDHLPSEVQMVIDATTGMYFHHCLGDTSAISSTFMNFMQANSTVPICFTVDDKDAQATIHLLAGGASGDTFLVKVKYLKKLDDGKSAEEEFVIGLPYQLVIGGVGLVLGIIGVIVRKHIAHRMDEKFAKRVQERFATDFGKQIVAPIVEKLMRRINAKRNAERIEKYSDAVSWLFAQIRQKDPEIADALKWQDKLESIDAEDRKALIDDTVEALLAEVPKGCCDRLGRKITRKAALKTKDVRTSEMVDRVYSKLKDTLAYLKSGIESHRSGRLPDSADFTGAPVDPERGRGAPTDDGGLAAPYGAPASAGGAASGSAGFGTELSTVAVLDQAAVLSGAMTEVEPATAVLPAGTGAAAGVFGAFGAHPGGAVHHPGSRSISTDLAVGSGIAAPTADEVGLPLVGAPG